jgi:hypothetical protein
MKDIALHLRYESKRTDLPEDVIRTLSEAYVEISRLKRERDAARREICDWSVGVGLKTTCQSVADFRNWDCFKEENNNG